MIEWVDHLHQHFDEPTQVCGGRTVIRAEAVARFSFLGGPAWRTEPREAGAFSASAPSRDE